LAKSSSETTTCPPADCCFARVMVVSPISFSNFCNAIAASELEISNPTNLAAVANLPVLA